MEFLIIIYFISVTHQSGNAEPEYTVKGLQEGKEYEFRIAASNKAGTGKFAQTESAIEARAPDCNI